MKDSKMVFNQVVIFDSFKLIEFIVVKKIASAIRGG